MRDRWSTGRLEAFSDGIFTIAATLLVLEINVPESGFDDLWKSIADQWPSYLAYMTSFLTIGGIWLAHHAIIRALASADRWVMRLNLLLLMFVAFLPFPTKLMAEAIDQTTAERAAVIFYGLTLLATSVAGSGLLRYIAANPELLKPDITNAQVKTIADRATPNMGFYVAGVLLAILAPSVAAFGYLLIAVVAIVRQRGDRSLAPA